MIGLKFSKKAVAFQGEAEKPNLLYIHTYGKMSKRDLDVYIYGLAEKYSESLRSCHYQISKFGKGFVIELQSGGNKLGVLKTTLKHLEENESAIIEIADGRKVMVTKTNKSGQSTITSHFLKENDDKQPTDNIVFVDKLNPIITNGYAIWRFSLAYAFLGILTMFAGAGVKFVVNDNSYQTNFIHTGKLVPLNQVNELMVAKPKENSYISALKFQNQVWSREEKQFENQKPVIMSSENQDAHQSIINTGTQSPQNNSNQSTNALDELLIQDGK